MVVCILVSIFWVYWMSTVKPVIPITCIHPPTHTHTRRNANRNPRSWWDFSKLQIQIKPTSQFEFVPRDTQKFKFNQESIRICTVWDIKKFERERVGVCVCVFGCVCLCVCVCVSFSILASWLKSLVRKSSMVVTGFFSNGSLSQVSFQMAHLKRDLNFDNHPNFDHHHRGVHFAFQWPFRVATSPPGKILYKVEFLRENPTGTEHGKLS